MALPKSYKQVNPCELTADILQESTTINWKLCVFCQQKTQESLQCPANSKRGDIGAGYKSAEGNIREMQRLGVLPSSIDIAQLDDGSGIENTLMTNKASWHKSCRNKINNTQIKRAQKRKQQEEESGTPSSVKTRRLSIETTKNVENKCFFCNEEAGSSCLRKASTYKIDYSVRKCATMLQDTTLLAKLAAGDMVAIDAQYHPKCLVSLYNSTRQLEKSSTDNNYDNSPHATVFTELISFLEECRGDPESASVFKLAELVQMYSKRLQELDVKLPCRVNATRLKERLLAVFPDLEAHTQGHNVLLIFNEDIGAAIRKACEHDSDDDSVHLAKAAKIIRRDVFKLRQSFSGTFSAGCQKQSVPSTLMTLVNLILEGSSIQKQTATEDVFQTASLTISQLLAFNSVKRSRAGDTLTASRHSRDRECPLSIYLALKIHGETRKRSLVDTLFNLGLCISYDRLLTISTDIANSVCARFEEEGVMCPPKLRSYIFTTAAVDNIDHNPSSTTASDSFHGTAISLTQHPTIEVPGIDRGVNVIDGTVQTQRKVSRLPEHFANVPPASLSMREFYAPPVPEGTISVSYSSEEGVQKEYEWLEKLMELMGKTCFSSNEFETWAAFHASRQLPLTHQVAITSLMPMFLENAHSVAMILHSMNVVKLAVQHVNPGQVPVIAMDQPLFALAKQIQWQWTETHGEDCFVIMFGGLHIEMAAFRALGQWLDGCGWTSVLEAAGIATAGVSNSFLKAAHLTRTRRAHQVTAASLYIMQQQAYQKYVNSTEHDQVKEFNAWKDEMSSKYPQFLYWSKVLAMQLIVLQLVRAFREANFCLYMHSLSQLIPWMFALDHINYARWLSVHFRDMCTLQVKHPDVLQHFNQGHFVVHKTTRAFSSIALDHAHEQVNALVKGDGGAVGLTESPGALRRWMVAGPEIARMVDEFETSSTYSKNETTNHHDQVPSVQTAFARDVTSLLSAFEEMGNPFQEMSEELLAIDTKDIVNTAVVDTVKNVVKIGRHQHDEFVKERFQERCKPVTEPLKKKKLPLFSSPIEKVQSKQKAHVAALKNDCALFSRLYIACQSRDGKLEDFFDHENQACPPSLSKMGKMRQGQKSDLVQCLESLQERKADAPIVDAKVLDGAVIVQMLSPGAATTFQDYADTVFVSYVVKQLQSVKRLDVVWDVYQADSLKKATRENRETGTRRRVEPSSKVPGNWKCFLRVDENKTELFKFLAKQIEETVVEGKELYSTFGEFALCSPEREDVSGIAPCTHEEADSRMILHVLDAARTGHEKIIVATNDTDVLVLTIAIFQDIPVNELWVAFGVGKHFRYLAAHELSNRLGMQKAKALPMFHAITGCDTVSFFAGRGKKTAWDVWKAFPAVTEAFLALMFMPERVSGPSLALVERFVVLLYDRTSALHEVNKARQELFCKRSRTVELIPPTRAALEQHTKRACYQAGYVWGQCLVPRPRIPSPSHWGWQKDGQCWQPYWTNLPEAKDTCYELIHCGCKKGCRGQCKCLRANLKCTALCQCGGACQ